LTSTFTFDANVDFIINLNINPTVDVDVIFESSDSVAGFVRSDRGPHTSFLPENSTQRRGGHRGEIFLSLRDGLDLVGGSTRRKERTR
jgi:hypothetical protein